MNVAHSIMSLAAEQGVIDRLQSYVATEDATIAAQQLADSDYWSSVGIITITGILVVFLILAILIFFFWLLGTIFKSIDNNKKKKAEQKKVEAEPAKPAPAQVEHFSMKNNADEEVMAAISAAIAAYAAEEGTTYTIKSVKKRKEIRTRSAWNLAGIGDNTRPF